MATLMGQDLPLERPDATGRAALFVPTPNAKADILEAIRSGAAVVGFGNHDRTLTIYYESNRFNEPNLVKWEQKARKAFDRLIDNLPTVSKMVVKQDNFEQVGYISSKGILIRRMEKLRNWLEKSDCLDGAPESEEIKYAPPPPPKKSVADT
ncbi:hypothetical protein ACLB1G_26795 [Oxalobacteraceae bacterium A2-2]